MTAVAVGAVFLHVLEAAAAMVVAKMRWCLTLLNDRLTNMACFDQLGCPYILKLKIMTLHFSLSSDQCPQFRHCVRHNIAPGTTIAWGFIVLVAGIFAFWPLLFPAFFFKVTLICLKSKICILLQIKTSMYLPRWPLGTAKSLDPFVWTSDKWREKCFNQILKKFCNKNFKCLSHSCLEALCARTCLWNSEQTPPVV